LSEGYLSFHSNDILKKAEALFKLGCNQLFPLDLKAAYIAEQSNRINKFQESINIIEYNSIKKRNICFNGIPERNLNNLDLLE
jgi:hypothetical protein